MTEPATRFSPWPVRAAKVITANVAVLGVLLVVFELVFGNWLRPISLNDLKRFSIPVEVEYQMDTSALYTRDGGPLITYTRDRWGLRGNYGKPAAIDVLTIGGSTTDQRYLDDSDTWQAFAQRRLEQLGVPLVFANAGVDGQSTTGHLFSLANWLPVLPELHPKIVLFYIGINDVMQPADRGTYDAKVDATSWRVKSVTWQILRTIRGNLRARDAQVTHGRKPVLTESDFTSTGKLPKERQAELASRLVQRFVTNVASLREQVLAMGAIPVFVTQTAYAWDAGPAAPRGLDRPALSAGEQMNFADVSALHRTMNLELLSYCEKERVLCFDLSTDVAFDESDFYDFLHTTPSGAQRIGTYIADELVEHSTALRLHD
jgi:lysophospholipase L1-like esterase